MSGELFIAQLPDSWAVVALILIGVAGTSTGVAVSCLKLWNKYRKKS